MLKPFFNKTRNRFVETSYVPVIGLRDVVSHRWESSKGSQWRHRAAGGPL